MSDYDIYRLRVNAWCSDNVMMLALRLRYDSLPTDKKEKMVLFDGQMYELLVNKGAANIWSSERSRQLNLFTKEFVLLPIFADSHFSMVAVVRPYLLVPGAANPHADLPCLLCMDSLRYHDMNTICSNLRGFLKEEWRRVYPDVPCTMIDGKSLPTVNASVPKQSNILDCAIYTYFFGTFARPCCVFPTFFFSQTISLPSIFVLSSRRCARYGSFSPVPCGNDYFKV